MSDLNKWLLGLLGTGVVSLVGTVIALWVKVAVLSVTLSTHLEDYNEFKRSFEDEEE